MMEDYTDIEFGLIEPKYKKNRIFAVKVYMGQVTIYRIDSNRLYEPRQEWLNKICDLLQDEINLYNAQVLLWPDGIQVDLDIGEDNE